MIYSVEIKNFRGIHHCKIDNFAQVNLLFGKNNCGKSSLLESLFLACGQSNPLLPASLNEMRTYSRMTETDIRYFFYMMDSSIPIEIITRGAQERRLDILSFREVIDDADYNSNSTEIAYRYGMQMKYHTIDGEFSSSVHYEIGRTDNKIERTARVDSRYIENIKCVYLSPRYDSTASLEGLQNIYLNKDEAFLADALKILEPSAKDPAFVENVMLVDIGLPQRIPINLMGDGIRKIVSFLTSIYKCPGGVVLIDELSNGFHYSVMKHVWDIVIRAAVRNNVQIFATTHDEDSIRGFQQAASRANDINGNELAAGFKLQRVANDELKSYRYSVEQLGYAIEQEMEVR